MFLRHPQAQGHAGGRGDGGHSARAGQEESQLGAPHLVQGSNTDRLHGPIPVEEPRELA